MQQHEHQASQPTPEALPQWEAPELQMAEVSSATLSGGLSNADGLLTFSS